MAVPDATDDWIETASSTLSAAERARMVRFFSSADRASYVAAHALLRAELAAELGVEPSAIDMKTDAFGKPKLAGEMTSVPCFSLTHTRRHVACAIGPLPMGIDIEEPDSQIDLSITSLLHPIEREQILDAPDVEKTNVFVRIWTLKEAILKAMGTGLRTPLNSFAVTLDPLQIKILPPKTDANIFHLETGIVGAATPISVAIWTGADKPQTAGTFDLKIAERTLPDRTKPD